MKTMQKIGFFIAVIIQLLVLGFMIVKQETLLRKGTKILLKCEPIDPRSLFSGDYVILNYEISNLDKSLLIDPKISDDEPLDQNDTVYVALEKDKDGKFWNALAISSNIRSLKEKYEIVIRGTINDYYSQYSIRYGVEEYFVPQFEGLEIESDMGAVSVEVAVSEKGDSAISRLFIDNKEVEFY